MSARNWVLASVLPLMFLLWFAIRFHSLWILVAEGTVANPNIRFSHSAQFLYVVPVLFRCRFNSSMHPLLTGTAPAEKHWLPDNQGTSIPSRSQYGPRLEAAKENKKILVKKCLRIINALWFQYGQSHRKVQFGWQFFQERKVNLIDFPWETVCQNIFISNYLDLPDKV